MKKIAVLFCEKKSIYKKLSGIDCYDIDRNALTFKRHIPVIAHPPCRLFSKLRHFCKADKKEKQLAFFSVKVVRKNGGILEHPAGSSLWKEARLPLPNESPDKFGGYTIKIDQFLFGHKARKSTLLYICGIKKLDIPAMSFKLGYPDYVVSTSSKRSNKKELSKKLRQATPIAFAKWLLKIARKCK